MRSCYKESLYAIKRIIKHRIERKYDKDCIEEVSDFLSGPIYMVIEFGVLSALISSEAEYYIDDSICEFILKGLRN